MGKEESESQYGFKNKEKADETIKLLAEHDLQYQKLTVRGLLGRAKRVLQSMVNEIFFFTEINPFKNYVLFQ